MRSVVFLMLLAGCTYDYSALGGRTDFLPIEGQGGSGAKSGAAGFTGVGGAGGARGGSGGARGGDGGGSGGLATAGAGGALSGTAGTGGTGGDGTGGADAATPDAGMTDAGPGTGGKDAGAAGSGAVDGGGRGAAGSGGRGGAGGTGSAGKGSAGSGGAGAGGTGAPNDPDLVLLYKFDEASGETVSDTSGFAGGPRNGSLATMGSGAAIAFSTTHRVGTHAVTLAPNGTIGGGYVVVPGLNNLAPDALTIAIWIYPSSNQDWQRVLDLGNDANTTYMFITTSEGADSNNYVRFGITTGGNSKEELIDSTASLSLNVWHHVVVVLAAGSPHAGSLYIDGALAGTNPAMTLHVSNLGATTKNYLGRSQFSDPYFKGSLDDFRVYRRGLTLPEITTIYGLR